MRYHTEYLSHALLTAHHQHHPQLHYKYPQEVPTILYRYIPEAVSYTHLLGNLVNRTISMTNKYFGGSVTDKGVAEAVDADLKAVVENTPKVVESKMNDLRVADAITEIFALFKRCNKYIDETMPWALAKDCLLYTSRCV